MHFKTGTGAAVHSKAAAMQDLERLFQIRQQGMRSEKLEKGFKKMKKSDIVNL